MGIGRAIALATSREGVPVVCADVDQRAVTETVRLIESDGGSAIAVTGDVTQEDACEAIAEAAIEAARVLHGVVLNVGVTGSPGWLARTSASDWDFVLSVNLRAHFLLCRALLPRLAVGSSVVFISSLAASKPGSRKPAYDASKAGLSGLCRHVALEGARRGIRANIVAPGFIDTPMSREASAGAAPRTLSSVPLGRLGTAVEIAQPTVFLLSDEAAYITGQTLSVDGGVSSLV